MMYYLHKLSAALPGQEFLRALQRLSVHHLPRASRAAVTAFLLSLMCGNWVIRRLISLKLGQPIRTKEEVHKLFELHGGKAGTPTMGGVLLLGASSSPRCSGRGRTTSPSGCSSSPCSTAAGSASGTTT